MARFVPQPEVPGASRDGVEPEGLRLIFPISSSLADTRYPPHEPKACSWGPRYASLLVPRTEENRLPPPLVRKLMTATGALQSECRRIMNSLTTAVGWRFGQRPLTLKTNHDTLSAIGAAA